MNTGFEVFISAYFLQSQVKTQMNTKYYTKLSGVDLVEERRVLAFCSLTCSVREGRFPDTIMLGNSGSVVCSILL